ncbi:PEGA domain-containing protein, partial [Rhodoplanes sp. TEM]
MTTVSNRVLAVAAAGLLLAGCESLSNFQVPSFGLGGPATVVLNLESDPPGAEATLSTGGSCRTPCTLPAPLTGEMTVAFALPGYQSTTVPVQVVRSEASGSEREFAGTTVTLDPNPVYVELQAVAPPAPPRRR